MLKGQTSPARRATVPPKAERRRGSSQDSLGGGPQQRCATIPVSARDSAPSGERFEAGRLSSAAQQLAVRADTPTPRRALPMRHAAGSHMRPSAALPARVGASLAKRAGSTATAGAVGGSDTLDTMPRARACHERRPGQSDGRLKRPPPRGESLRRGE